MFPFFELFGHVFTFYAVFMLTGAAAALLVCILISPKFNIERMDAFFLTVIGFAGGIVGAQVLYYIVTLPEIIRILRTKPDVPWSEVLKPGMVFWGGFLGGIACVLLVIKLFGLAKMDVLNMLAAPLALGHGFGRIGCLSGGCCYGVPCEHGIVFTHSPVAPNHVPLFPTQPLEAGFNFLLAFVLLFLLRFPRLKPYLCHVYLFCYPLFRFIIEFYRGDQVRGIYWGFSTSQWISFALFVFNLIWFALRIRRRSEALREA